MISSRVINGIIASAIFGGSFYGFSQNPIVPDQGSYDPHIHVFNDTAYFNSWHNPHNIKDESIKGLDFLFKIR